MSAYGCCGEYNEHSNTCAYRNIDDGTKYGKSYVSALEEAADALAKAYQRLFDETSVDKPPFRQAAEFHWDRTNKALAAYEKVRGMTIGGLPVRFDPSLKPDEWRIEKK